MSRCYSFIILWLSILLLKPIVDNDRFIIALKHSKFKWMPRFMWRRLGVYIVMYWNTDMGY